MRNRIKKIRNTDTDIYWYVMCHDMRDGSKKGSVIL